MKNIAFCAFGTENITLEELQIMSTFIPQERIEKSKRYYHFSDRSNCIASYFILLYGLAKEYGIFSVPCICLNNYGKPFLKDNANIFFNISHCKDAVCCAFSQYNTGIDIQDKIVASETIIDFVMSKEEKNTIIASDDPELICARYWSQKEAYLKYKATGLTNDLFKYDFSSFESDNFKFIDGEITTKTINDYSISICNKKDRTIIISDNISNYIKEFLKIYYKYKH